MRTFTLPAVSPLEPLAASRARPLVSLALLLALAGPGLAQEPLPCGESVSGTTTDQSPASFVFEAPSGGLLGVIVRADDDVYLSAQADGADVGRWDADHGGNLGAEQFGIPVLAAGVVTVNVHTFSEASFTICGVWVPEGEPGGDCGGVLPVGGVGTGSAPGEYTIEAETAGLLVVLAAGEEDLYLTFKDSAGTLLGREDTDFQGDVGVEPAAFAIPRAGTFTLEVGSLGEACEILLCCEFLSLPDLEEASDPDASSPADAIELVQGTECTNELDPSINDNWDWFVFTAAEDGRVTFEAYGSEDIGLSLFEDGELDLPAEWSDNDLGGDAGHESIEVEVTAGATYYLKVEPVLGGAASYTLSAN
jgi:hypothetical protein